MFHRFMVKCVVHTEKEHEEIGDSRFVRRPGGDDIQVLADGAVRNITRASEILVKP
jgi:hypothetical protein